MSRSRSRMLRGHAALRGVIACFNPPTEQSNELSSLVIRNDYANREAILAFLADLRTRSSRRVYAPKNTLSGEQDSYRLSDARFRPLDGDPDIDGDEGCFGFGDRRVTMDGIRIRLSAPGVLEMADRWGDDAMFGSYADAPFDESVWSIEE